MSVRAQSRTSPLCNLDFARCDNFDHSILNIIRKVPKEMNPLGTLRFFLVYLCVKFDVNESHCQNWPSWCERL